MFGIHDFVFFSACAYKTLHFVLTNHIWFNAFQSFSHVWITWARSKLYNVVTAPWARHSDKHSVYETQGVQGRETESEEEAHLLRGFCFVLLLRPHAECE